MEETIHFLLLNDQPVTCPKCSARTTFYEKVDAYYGVYEVHTCLNKKCEYDFFCIEDVCSEE